MTPCTGLDACIGDEVPAHIVFQAPPSCAGLGPHLGIAGGFQSPWAAALAPTDLMSCIPAHLWQDVSGFQQVWGSSFEATGWPAMLPVPLFNAPPAILPQSQWLPHTADGHEKLQTGANWNQNQQMQSKQWRHSLHSKRPLNSTKLSSIPECSGEPGDSFTFTLLKAHEVPLGITFADAAADEQELICETVQPDSAIDAWNQSCITAGNINKTVEADDRIVSVNGISCQRELMLQECEEKALLKIVLVRGAAAQSPPVHAGKQVVLLDRCLDVGSSSGSVERHFTKI